MKAARIRKNNKKEKEKTFEEEYSFKKMSIIIITIIIVFLAFYFITTLVVKQVKDDNSNNVISELDSTKITLNHLLDRKEQEYFVLATKKSLYQTSSYSNIDYTEIYNKYIKDYSLKENSIAFYYVDLDDALNRSFISEEINITENIENLRINDEILFKVIGGKINSYYVGNSEIIKALSSL